MNRTFRLAGLLRLRTLDEERAAVDRAVHARHEGAAADRVRGTAERLHTGALPTDVDALAWQAAVAGRASLSALLVEHAGALDAARVALGEADARWTAARVATRSLDRLAEQHDAAVRTHDLRTEQAVLDEVGARTSAAHAPAGHGAARGLVDGVRR